MSKLGRLVALVCVVLVGATLAACAHRPPPRPRPRSPSTTASTSRPPTQLVAAFEKQTGITVKVRNDDEDVLANQIITEGSASPGRRHLHRELARAREAPGERGAGPGRPVDPGHVPGQVQLAQGRLGRGVAPGSA